MAKTIEEILGRSISTTKELREAIKQLQDQLVNASSDTQEWTETAEKLTAAQTKLKEVMDAGKQSVDAAEDSIVGMERQYKELYNTYKLLTDEQRKSPFGKQMAQELETLSTKLNETKKGVGNFKDNIGRYTDSAIEAFGAMGVSVGGLTTPLGLANGGFKALNATMAANPVFWLITAIKLLISVFNKVKEAIAGNEESQMRLNQAMAAFQPVIDAVSNSFDKMGQVVVTVIEVVSKAYTKIRELWAGFTDFLGITEGAKEQIQETNRLYADLAKRTNELTLAKREQTKLNASQQAEVKTLLDQAAGTANATEKMNLLNEAKRIQQEITDRNIQIAQEEYDLLLEKSKLTANDAEMNDKLAEAEANVARARAEGAEKTKEMTSQILGLTNQTNKYAEALKKEKDELDNLLKTIEENSKTEIQKLDDKYKKELALLKKYGKDTTELTRQYAIARAEAEVNAYNETKSKLQELVSGAYGENSEQNLRLNMDIAGKEYDRAKNMVENVQAQIKTYQEQGLISAETITNIWEKVGAKLGGAFTGIKTWEEAVAALKSLKNASNEAKTAYERFLTVTALEQNESSENNKERELLEEKVKILNDETLTYEQRNEKIKALDNELLEYKMQNTLWEIENLDLTNEQKLAKWQEYYAALKALKDQEAEEERQRAQDEIDTYYEKIDVANKWIGVGGDILYGIQSLSDAIAQNIEITKDDEEQTKESTEKKKKQLKTLQDIQLGVSLAMIAADTAVALMDVWSAYAGQTAANTSLVLPPFIAAADAISLGEAIARTVGISTMGAAQMAAAIAGNISNKKSIDGMGGSSTAAAGTIAAPAVIDTTPYSYTRQVQTAEEEAALNRPIWVSVTDIESGMNHVKVVDQESTF